MMSPITLASLLMLGFANSAPITEPADWESCPLDANITLTCGVQMLDIRHCLWNFNGSAITHNNNVLGFVTENFNITVPCDSEMNNMTLTCQCVVGDPPEAITGYNKTLVIEETATTAAYTTSNISTNSTDVSNDVTTTDTTNNTDTTSSTATTPTSDATTSAPGPCMLIILACITALGQEPVV